MPLNFPSNPTNGQVYDRFFWDSAAGIWKNTVFPASLDSLSDATITSPSSGQLLRYNGTQWVNHTPVLSNISDVVPTTPAIGDALVYNGTNWINAPRSGNVIINGDFGIWQRGTSFSNPASSSYTVDRYSVVYDGSGASRTLSREPFSSGELTVPGYGSPSFFLRYRQQVAGSGGTFNNLEQRIEDVTTFSNQQVTVSFWARTSTSSTITVVFGQLFGTGGSSSVFTSTGGSISLTNSWVRYSRTVTLPGVSGKTIGANNSLALIFAIPLNSVSTIDIWGVQVEAGPVATPFRLAGGGSQAAELALCQRYYYRISSTDGFCASANESTVLTNGVVNFPVTMRTAPSALEQSGVAGNYNVYEGATAITCSNVPVFLTGGPTSSFIRFQVASGLTLGRASILRGSGFLAWSAEL